MQKKKKKGFSLWNFPPLGLSDDSSLFAFPKAITAICMYSDLVSSHWATMIWKTKLKKSKTKNLKVTRPPVSLRLSEVLEGCPSALSRWFWATGNGRWKLLCTFPGEIMSLSTESEGAQRWKVYLTGGHVLKAPGSWWKPTRCLQLSPKKQLLAGG